MATVIKNINDLKRIFEPRIRQALKMTQNIIWEVIQKHIDDYYSEYDPSRYIRTFKFQTESLIKTDIIKSGNQFFCTVRIDPDYLNYTYPGDYMTGLGVAMDANQHTHGGIYDDDFGCFWNDAMEELGLDIGIIRIMKSNLKECGVPIKY